jgi:hypothetical protein
MVKSRGRGVFNWGLIATKPLDHSACLHKYRNFGGRAESMILFVATRRGMPPGGLPTMIEGMKPSRCRR